MKIEQWPLSRLKPYTRNPRINQAVEKVAASIKSFGVRQPIVVDRKGVIIVGHARYLAAKQLNLSTFPVHVATNLTPAQARAYRIADNRTNEAEWDPELLNIELEDLKEDGFDLALTGFDANELLDMLAKESADDTEKAVDVDDAPPLPERAETVAGEIILLGRHRLICGDCTDRATMARLMDRELADLVWTDPPYNVAYTGKTEDALTITNDRMPAAAFGRMLRAAFAGALSVTKRGGAIYVAHADTEGVTFRSALVEAGWMFKQCLVWVKNSLVMGRHDYHWRHEPILYGWKPGAKHPWFGGRDKSTVLEFDRPHRNDRHPTMKPVALVQHCLDNSGGKGARVLDLFAGSGSTFVAAEKTDRTAYLVELDPAYCDVIVQRYHALTGKTAKRVRPKLPPSLAARRRRAKV